MGNLKIVVKHKVMSGFPVSVQVLMMNFVMGDSVV